MEEPGRLQSMGSLRVRHHWATSLSLFTFMHWRRKWQPTPVFLPENPRDGVAWWAAVHGVTQSQTWLKWLSSSSSFYLANTIFSRQFMVQDIACISSKHHISTFLSAEKDRKKDMFSLATWPHLVTSHGECATHCRWPCIQVKIRCSLVKDSRRYQGEQSVCLTATLGSTVFLLFDLFTCFSL